MNVKKIWGLLMKKEKAQSQKLKRPLVAVMLMLALSALTACTSTNRVSTSEEVSESFNVYVKTILSEFPLLPEVPSFPELNWTYQNGLYGIGDEDVDKLLNYAENTIPLFKHNLETYEEKVNVIIKALTKEQEVAPCEV